MTAFEIRGNKSNFIKLEITEIYGYPDSTCYYGGYEIKCQLEIACGVFHLFTDSYFSSTGALYDFYQQLVSCYSDLNGTARYLVVHGEDNLLFNVAFNQGTVTVKGTYRENDTTDNTLHFEFLSDQSYFISVLCDLKQVTALYGDNSGVK